MSTPSEEMGQIGKVHFSEEVDKDAKKESVIDALSMAVARDWGHGEKAKAGYDVNTKDADVIVTVTLRKPTRENVGHIAASVTYPKREAGRELCCGYWDQNTINVIKSELDGVFAQQEKERYSPYIPKPAVADSTILLLVDIAKSGVCRNNPEMQAALNSALIRELNK
jgi:hypothetical protein